MRESQILFYLKELKKIQPSKDWAVLTKKQIFGETKKESFIETIRPAIDWLFQYRFYKPVYVGVILVLVFLGTFGFTQNSLPGDLLYPVKKVVEKGQAVFISKDQKTEYNLTLVNKRLEELTKIVESNQINKVAPAISEFQANLSQAVKDLAKIDATTSDPVLMKKIVEETKKLEENKEKVESLGVIMEDTDELENILSNMTRNVIEDLEGRTLTIEKENILNEMKKLYEEGKYSEALEFYLINQ